MTATVKLVPELEAKIRARLSPGETFSDFVRRAIIEMVEREDQAPTAHDLWARHFDGWGSGKTDRSERVKDIVREKLRAKHRAR